MATTEGINGSVVTSTFTSFVSNAYSENATTHSSDLNATTLSLDLNNTTVSQDYTSMITAATTHSNKAPPATVLGLFFAIVIFAAVVAIYFYIRNRRQKRKNQELMALRGRGREGEVKETLYSDVVRAVHLEEEVADSSADKETHYITIDFDSNARIEEEELTLLETSSTRDPNGTENTQL